MHVAGLLPLLPWKLNSTFSAYPCAAGLSVNTVPLL